MADKLKAADYQKSPVVQAGGYLCLVQEGSEVVGRSVSFTAEGGAEVKGQTFRQEIDFVTKDFLMQGAWHKIGFVREGENALPERMAPGVYILQARWRLGDDGALAFDRVRMFKIAELGEPLV